jgi:PAS domain S-box-containing protein
VKIKMGSHLRSLGIRRKIFLAVIFGVILSIGISTTINVIRFSNDLLLTTEERVSQISQSTKAYTLEKISHQMDLLVTISISESLKTELREANKRYGKLSNGEREKRIEEIESIWGTEDAQAVSLIDQINQNSISTYLTRFKNTHPDQTEIFVTDKFGQLYATSNLTSDYWQGDEEWWQETFSNKLFVSEPIYDESSETWAVIISVPVFDDEPGSEVIGVVRGTIDITRLFESIFDPSVGDTSFGAFIDNSGNVYYQSQNELVVSPVSDDIFIYIQSDKDVKNVVVNDTGNVPSIAAKVKLEIQGHLLGWIVIFTHKSEIDEIITASIFGNILIAIGLIIILGSLSLFISNSILNVLENLKQGAFRIAVGDYSYNFSKDLQNSNDPDIFSVVNSIEKMKGSIQTRENRIREREKEYRQLVETMSEGLVVANYDGTISYVNPRLCQLIGYQYDEIVGKPFIHYFHKDLKDNTLRLWNNPEMMKGQVYESQLITNRGNIVYAAISTEPQFDELGEYTGVLAVITDISDRKAFEMNLQRKLNEIASLREIDMSILSQEDYDGVVNTVLQQIRNHLHADGAAIFVASPITKALEFASGFFLKEMIAYDQMDIDHDSFQHIADLKEGRQIDKTSDENLVCDWFKDKDFNVLYIMPIEINDINHGFVEIAYFDEINLDEEWHNYFNALITQMAVGISKIHLIKDLKESNVVLKEAYDGIIRGWAKALELRDEETKGHSDRVYELSVKMALKNNYTDRKLEAFRRGALLHDIGKMGIPDSILLKPGKLTPEEWNIMKLHPDLAYVLLSEIPFLREAIEIPYYHHERWDGSGYPSGLKGEDIPLAARIFAVIDVWDALTSNRPYRQAWSKQKTRDYLIQNKGIQFDPDIVDQFFELLIEEGEF